MATSSSAASSARDKAYRTALAAISGMHVGKEGFIREEDLVEQAGVSRTPVREALQRLQAEGLIRLVPRKGAYVSAVTPYEIQDFLDCRNLFETFGADAVIERGDPEALARLDRIIRQQRDGLADGVPHARLMELDHELHITLVESSRNALIAEMYRSLRNREMRLMLTALSRSGQQRWAGAIEEHQQIVDCLRARDVAGARAAIRNHCWQTGKAAIGELMTIMRQEPGRSRADIAS